MAGSSGPGRQKALPNGYVFQIYPSLTHHAVDVGLPPNDVYADLVSGLPAAGQRRSDFVRFDWYVVLFDMACDALADQISDASVCGGY